MSFETFFGRSWELFLFHQKPFFLLISALREYCNNFFVFRVNSISLRNVGCYLILVLKEHFKFKKKFVLFFQISLSYNLLILNLICKISFRRQRAFLKAEKFQNTFPNWGFITSSKITLPKVIFITLSKVRSLCRKSLRQKYDRKSITT